MRSQAGLALTVRACTHIQGVRPALGWAGSTRGVSRERSWAGVGIGVRAAGRLPRGSNEGEHGMERMVRCGLDREVARYYGEREGTSSMS